MASARKKVAPAKRSRTTGKKQLNLVRGASAARAQPTLERRVRRLERACRDLRSAAETAEEAQRELIAIVSHDLRNPLSVILVSARLILRTLGAEERGAGTRRQIEAIGRAADEINHLVQDLVDAASIDAENLVVAPEPNDAASLVERAVAGIRPLAAQKPLSIDVDVAADMPQVLGDRERIHQVLQNLMCHSLRFTPKGGSIRVRADSFGGEARFAIVDNGPGIAAEQWPHLFTRQRPGAARVGQGTGLGVFVARGIVLAHRGRIWVESAPGGGCAFYFTLPAERARAAPSTG
jgi:signal transduction histidine kinase